MWLVSLWYKGTLSFSPVKISLSVRTLHSHGFESFLKLHRKNLLTTEESGEIQLKQDWPMPCWKLTNPIFFLIWKQNVWALTGLCNRTCGEYDLRKGGPKVSNFECWSVSVRKHGEEISYFKKFFCFFHNVLIQLCSLFKPCEREVLRFIILNFQTQLVVLDSDFWKKILYCFVLFK